MLRTPSVLGCLGLLLCCWAGATAAHAAESTLVVREPALDSRQREPGSTGAGAQLKRLSRAFAEAATRIEEAQAKMSRASTPCERVYWQLEYVRVLALQFGVKAEIRILRRRVARRLQGALAKLRREHQRRTAWRSSRPFQGMSRLAQAVFALADERAPGADSPAVRRALRRWAIVKRAWSRPPPVNPEEARRISAVYVQDRLALRAILGQLDALEAYLQSI